MPRAPEPKGPPEVLPSKADLASKTYDDKGNAAVYRYQVEDGAGVDRRALPEANRRAQSREAATYISSLLSDR